MAINSDWREKNRTVQISNAAEEGKYGVIAAIAYIEQILGLVKVAEAARSPLIIQFFPWAITFSDGLLVRAASDAAHPDMVPISIHLDHAQDEALIKRAADNLPFVSIMVDIGEDGVLDTAGLEASKTTLKEVDNFIATGVESLAPAFGNVHGEYGIDGPQLDFERRIRAQANGRVRLVLHGTNGFSPELLKEYIAAGVSKINVNRLVLDEYCIHLRSQVSRLSHTTLLEEGVQKVVAQTAEWIGICGSAGKA
ncbi:hypothetical protein B0J13DRAFT_665826 [Dactylonectria estremocensis]|uniref:Fructose-bisphosphate aldolase n=1 Tax=Dactylonectria estremocensis TaxID=1079267 RepID=A0A9P9EVN0_9HYPO|nr:hypothetical protein B0J13DRAFT_665826 [Dactylonectria estremocensis]